MTAKASMTSSRAVLASHNCRPSQYGLVKYEGCITGKILQKGDRLLAVSSRDYFILLRSVVDSEKGIRIRCNMSSLPCREIYIVCFPYLVLLIDNLSPSTSDSSDITDVPPWGAK
jgi:hypothetical protein